MSTAIRQWCVARRIVARAGQVSDVPLLQVHSTFVDGDFKSSGATVDAAMQDGLGLLSYVKLYLRSNSSQHLNFAQHFARYLIEVRPALLCCARLVVTAAARCKPLNP
jgi:hypothetical protein